MFFLFDPFQLTGMYQHDRLLHTSSDFEASRLIIGEVIEIFSHFFQPLFTGQVHVYRTSWRESVMGSFSSVSSSSSTGLDELDGLASSSFCSSCAVGTFRERPQEPGKRQKHTYKTRTHILLAHKQNSGFKSIQCISANAFSGNHSEGKQALPHQK